MSRALARAVRAPAVAPVVRVSSAQLVVHTPVLLERVIDCLRPRAATAAPYWVLDATVGTGGHAAGLLAADARVRVVGIDRDAAALSAAASGALQPHLAAGRVVLARGSYAHAARLAAAALATGRGPAAAAASTPASPPPFDAVLIDTGLGAHQLRAGSGRGFSYLHDEPLDMRYGGAAEGGADEGGGGGAAPRADASDGGAAVAGAADAPPAAAPRAAPLTASSIASTWPAWRLRAIFEAHGGLAPALAGALASALVAWRGSGGRRRAVRSSLELRVAIEAAVAVMDAPASPLALRAARRGFSKASLWVDHKGAARALRAAAGRRPPPAAAPAVRAVFHALRVAVNDEFGALRALLAGLPALLRAGGAVAALTYTPAEDAVVAAAFGALARRGGWAWGGAAPGGEPERADAREARANPAARTARLRVLRAPPLAFSPPGEPPRAAAAGGPALADAVRAAAAAASPRPAPEPALLDRVPPARAFDSYGPPEPEPARAGPRGGARGGARARAHARAGGGAAKRRAGAGSRRARKRPPPARGR